MGSWIHLFSKFTPEALLFESLVICILIASYSAFWILRKRRFGPVESTIPAGVVKAYLNELIVDAEALRAQLFGLLAGAGFNAGDAAKYAAAFGSMKSEGPSLMAPMLQADPGMAAKLAVLEAKMAEQARAMETMLLEKTRLSAELQSARTGGAAPASGDGDASALAKLQEKIRTLEGKLNEYSVIEDDLANLKRLQQENAQLRASLGAGAPVSTPASAPSPTATAAKPAKREPEPAPVTAAPAVEEVAMPVLETEHSPQAAEPSFDALATEVERSLEPAAEPPAGATALPPSSHEEALNLLDPRADSAMPSLEEVNSASALPATPAGAAAANQEKSDADLVAEFEKMLNG